MRAEPAELPGGVVTFVFTDIEGSTRLFHQLGDRFVSLLEHHRDVLHGVFTGHGGAVVSAAGDEFFVAFSDAAEAVEACADAQRSLLDVDWPLPKPLRVRVGVHRGLASPHHGDYVALAVHQAKRVMEAAHGGQILVSDTVAEGFAPSPQLRLRRLGLFRLRGFPNAVGLHQVEADGLSREFAAVRALPADRHNITRHPTVTIGRDDAITHISRLMEPGRTITLTGPGGVGKSRIAEEVGMAVAPEWRDGVWMVELSGIGDGALVAPAAAAAVGAPIQTGGSRLDDLLEHLTTRHMALLFDNCEHVLTASRDLIDAIRGSSPDVVVLATSREPLRVRGEQIWPVKPLAVPQRDHPAPEDVRASGAGRLFSERAAAVRPGFAIDRDNASAVADLCRHLDGLPLLIELAAAHVSAREPAEILEGLEDRFRLLRSPDRTVPDRHRTAEGLLEWSYRLLEPAERTALRRLSLFAAGFSRDRVFGLLADVVSAPEEAASLVWSLVDRSLITADLAAGGTRYRLFETVQSYARRLLEGHGEVAEAATSLAEVYLERLGPWHPVDRAWIDEMDAEIGNLRALLPLLPPEREEWAQQIACSIGWHHDVSQTFRDGIDELGRLAKRLPRPTPSRVAMLTTLGWLLLRTGNVDAAGETAETAETLRADHGAPEWDDVGVERIRGEIAQRSGDPRRAITIARSALDRPLSDRGRGRMCNLLGMASAAVGDHDTAYTSFRREVELYESLGYEGMVAGAHGNLAEVALRMGDTASAAFHQQACLQTAVEQGSTAMVALSLIAAASIAALRTDWAGAAALHARAEVLLEEIGLLLYDDDLHRSERLMVDARTHLGREAFAEAIAAGRALPLPEAIQSARDLLEAGGGPAA